MVVGKILGMLLFFSAIILIIISIYDMNHLQVKPGFNTFCQDKIGNVIQGQTCWDDGITLQDINETKKSTLFFTIFLSIFMFSISWVMWVTDNE